MRPRTEGESFNSRTSLTLFRPRAFTDRRWRAWQPRRPLTRRTRTVAVAFLSVALLSTMGDLLELLAALGRDVARRLHGGQTLEGRAHQVDRVTRTDGLGQHVLHANSFEDGAHRATGDDAGTLGGGHHEHAGRAVAGLDRVPQGAFVEVDGNHRLARLLHRLLDRDRHFTRLAVAEADLAGAVADDGQRGESELATALDGLGDAVDRDQLLDEAVVAFAAIAIAFVAAHWFESCWKGFACGLAAYSCGRSAGSPLHGSRSDPIQACRTIRTSGHPRARLPP